MRIGIRAHLNGGESAEDGHTRKMDDQKQNAGRVPARYKKEIIESGRGDGQGDMEFGRSTVILVSLDDRRSQGKRRIITINAFVTKQASHSN